MRRLLIASCRRVGGALWRQAFVLVFDPLSRLCFNILLASIGEPSRIRMPGDRPTAGSSASAQTSDEGKTAWVTDKAPIRQFDTFAP